MTKLTAKEGYVYTLKSDNSVYGKEIYLGVNDDEDNWVEIPEPIDDDFERENI